MPHLLRTRFGQAGRLAPGGAVSLVWMAILVAALLSVLTCSGCTNVGGDKPESDGTTADKEAGATTDEESLPVLTAALGETIPAAQLEIRVISSGPAVLHPAAPPVEEGMERVEVRATAKNVTAAPLPLNASPYSVYNTVLNVNGTRYPGSLVTGALKNVSSGAIPPGVELNLRYVFEVPKGSSSGTFIWPPAITSGEFPIIDVPINNLMP